MASLVLFVGDRFSSLYCQQSTSFLPCLKSSSSYIFWSDSVVPECPGKSGCLATMFKSGWRERWTIRIIGITMTIMIMVMTIMTVTPSLNCAHYNPPPPHPGVWSDPWASRVPCAHQRQHDRPLQGIPHSSSKQSPSFKLSSSKMIIRPPEAISTHMGRLTELQQLGWVQAN